MKLLVLCDTVDRTGGTESYLARVLPALRERGVDLTIAARRVVEPGAFGGGEIELGWGADDAPVEPRVAERIRGLIARDRPDVVMTSNVHDALALEAARTAARLVVRVHDHRLFCPQGNRRYPHFSAPCALAMSSATCLGHALSRGCVAGVSPRTLRIVRDREALARVVRRADRLVVAAPYMADLCLKNGVAPERVAVVNPPFEGRIARAPRPAFDRVLFAGRLVSDKGAASLIRALGRLPAQTRPALAIAGSMTREGKHLPVLAQRLGVEATFLGKVPGVAMRREYDASTIVAVPSLWPEPFGLVGIEALARGRPVVAYDVGGISSWLGEAGILVRAGDEAALARAIRAALEPQRWRPFSDAALRQAPRYELERHVDGLLRELAAQAEPLQSEGVV